MKRPLLAIASLVVAAALSFGAAAPVYAQAPDKPKRFPQTHPRPAQRPAAPPRRKNSQDLGRRSRRAV